MRTHLLKTLAASTALALVSCSEDNAAIPPVSNAHLDNGVSSSTGSSSSTDPSSSADPDATGDSPSSTAPAGGSASGSASASSDPPALDTSEPAASTTQPPPALVPGGPSSSPAATSAPSASSAASSASTTSDPDDPPTSSPEESSNENPFPPFPQPTTNMGSGGTADPPGTSTPPTTPPGEVDCNAAMPSGGEAHVSANAQGKAGGLDWTIWSNGSAGTITTFDVPAFSASWNNSGGLLARLGLQWDTSKTYDEYGTITAQFASNKTGTAGGYSYVGIYGWSVDPCVEFYIVDDSYNPLPFNPGMTTNKGTAEIDGATYTMYTRQTTGTGGSKCPGVNSWIQFYSFRNTARTCGTISVTEHFDWWAANGMELGLMDQVQLMIEVGGGTGEIEFPVANVTTTQ